MIKGLEFKHNAKLNMMVASWDSGAINTCETRLQYENRLKLKAASSKLEQACKELDLKYGKGK